MSFLTNYLHACGTSEVPRAFHRWVGLSVLAATLHDRVFMRKGAGVVKPNLYVFLIGPSGVGKGDAITTALRLLKDHAHVHTLYGRITAAALVDLLASKAGMAASHAKVYLATPELAMAVGRGPMADDLIKLMTELYAGSDYAPIVERTRTSGRHVIRNHCLNWVAGTTREWLRDCVTKEAVEGGFFARVACIQAAYTLKRRIVTPQLPQDYEETVDRLHAHLERLVGVSGEVVFDPRAETIHEEWYLTRPEPQDETLVPSWKREDDFVRKLAMLLALAEDEPQEVVTAAHVVEAQRLASETARDLPTIIEYIGAGIDNDVMARVRAAIRQAGTIHHTALSRATARFGVTHDKLRLYVDTLVDGGLITRVKQPRGEWVYRWGTRDWGTRERSFWTRRDDDDSEHD